MIRILVLNLWIVIGFLACYSQTSEENMAFDTPPNPNSPYLKITTKSKIKDEPKTKGLLEIWGNNKHEDLNIGIEYRGAVSQSYYDKKSYGLELLDSTKQILGLPKAKKWILHGPYGDKTLMRNVLAYDLSNQIGRYASRTKYVELEINGQYKGLYVLMEKIEAQKNRVNLNKKELGSFLIKIDKNAGNNGNWDDYNTANSIHSNLNAKGKISKNSKIYFLFDYPKAKSINAEHRTFIGKTMNEFESSLAGPQFKDPNIGYQKHIDMDSFIDYFILTELMQNHDGYRISTFLVKELNQKLKMGPIWDFDIAFGSDQGFCDGMNDHAWVYQYNKYCPDDPWIVPFWWEKLVSDPFFKNKLLTRYHALRKTTLSDKNLENTIEKFNKELIESGAMKRNFQKWNILNQAISPNSSTGPHSKEIQRLKNWLKEHAHWMDEEILKI